MRLMRRCVLPAPARITRPIKMAGIVDSDAHKRKRVGRSCMVIGDTAPKGPCARCRKPPSRSLREARKLDGGGNVVQGPRLPASRTNIQKYYLRMHPSRPRRWRVVQALLSSLSLSTKAWTSSLSSSISPVLTSSPWLWSFRNSFVNFWAFFLNAVLFGMTFCFR